MVDNIYNILIVIFIVSCFGYVFAVMKEKVLLDRGIVIIENKNVTQEHLDEADIKEFQLGSLRVKAGDEVKITTAYKEKHKGIVLGAKRKEREIMIVTNRDEIKGISVDIIIGIKVTRKYGRFYK